MAYVNVAEWSPEQVSEWLKGLDDALLPYLHHFVKNRVDGKRLLQLSPDDLPPLQVSKIGHQEIVLQGVELLRNIHYQLHQENVQSLALRLCSKARSIYNELRCPLSDGTSDGEEERNEEEQKKYKQERVSTAVLSRVADVLSSVKSLVSWLNRVPFEGTEVYDELKSTLVELSIRLATIAQRDMFAENQSSIIRDCCMKLAEMSDKIIQEFSDPLIIQPASLDVATIKKKTDDELGVVLHSSYHGIHQVSGVRALSPAHQCGKLMEGDELVQVNYQIVVGWQSHKVAAAMQENPMEVILTLKKRPKHSNTVTQIYFKPFRLPSKKRVYSPWGGIAGLQSIPNLHLIKSFDKVYVKRGVNTEPEPKSLSPLPNIVTQSPTPPHSPLSELEESELEDDAFLSGDDSDPGSASPLSARLYQQKPQTAVHRRATIPGSVGRPSLAFNQLLQEIRGKRLSRAPPEDAEEDLVRPKSSNEERIARPHTCIGTERKSFLMVSPTMGKSGDVLAHKKTIKSDGNDLLKGKKISGSNKTVVITEPSKPPVSTEEAGIGGVVNIIPLPPRKSGTQKSPALPARKGQEGTDTMEMNDVSDVPGMKCDLNILGSVTSTSHTLAALGSAMVALASFPASLSSPMVTQPSPVTTISSPAVPMSPLISLSMPPLVRPETPPSAISAFIRHFSSSALTPMKPRAMVEQLRWMDNVANPVYGKSIAANNPDDPKTRSDLPPLVPVNCFNKVEGEQLHRSNGVAGNGEACITTIGAGKAEGTNGDVPSVLGFVEAGFKEAWKPGVAPVVFRSQQSRSPSVWRRGMLLDATGNRRISCRDLGRGDQQGWLYRRRDSKSFLHQHRWERRWYILKKNYLYGYLDKEAVKADSLVYLPGFHVCPAADVKSKKFAFKIYHSSGATFYFACDTAEERSRWMSQMGLSAISSQPVTPASPVATSDVYFSETEDELDERSTSGGGSPQSPPERISPGKETPTKPGRRSGSSSPHCSQLVNNPRTSPLFGSLGASLGNLGSGKGQALRFLHGSSPDSLSKAVPTAGFRSYRRVKEEGLQTASMSDLHPSPDCDAISVKSPVEVESPTAAVVVARKNSLRERLRQFPASFAALDRRGKGDRKGSKGHIGKAGTAKVTVEHPSLLASSTKDSLRGNSISSSSVCVSSVVSPQEEARGIVVPVSPPNVLLLTATIPHYMRPTRASSIGGSSSPSSRPSSVDLDSRDGTPFRGGRLGSTPSVMCSPMIPLGNGESRLPGNLGDSSQIRCKSPRRGSLDCLSAPVSACLVSPTPTTSPPHTPSRSCHSSASSLAICEEYREGSPEKLWINSLRTEGTKYKPPSLSRLEKPRGRTVSTDALVPSGVTDRLKRGTLYHPVMMRGSQEAMRMAFELSLDPSGAAAPLVQKGKIDSRSCASVAISKGKSISISNVSVRRDSTVPIGNQGMGSPSRPEVPPRTKFLSPSERALPHTSANPHSVQQGSVSSQSKLKHVPSLKISNILQVDNDGPPTPVKPAMGVPMIGKQRRTPCLFSPAGKDVFFSSPPHSPILAARGLRSPPVEEPIGVIVTSHILPAKQKILPHYPGMEYPPTFEATTYSLSPVPPLNHTPSPVPPFSPQGIVITHTTPELVSSSGNDPSVTLSAKCRHMLSPPRLRLPSPPSLPPSDDEGTWCLKTSFTQTESVGDVK